MPVLHVFADLGRDVAAATVVFLVERLVHVVNDCSEVALHRIEVDRALSVFVDAVVNVGNGRLHRPIQRRYGRRDGQRLVSAVGDLDRH